MDGEASRPAHAADSTLWREATDAVLASRADRVPDHAAESETLLALAGTIAGDPVDFHHELCGRLMNASRAQAAAVFLAQTDPAGAGQFRLAFGIGVAIEHGSPATHHLADLCTLSANRQGPAIWAWNGPEGVQPSGFSAPAREVLAAPVIIEGVVEGVMLTFKAPGRDGFDNEDIRRIGTLAKFAASTHQALAVQADLRANEARYRALVTCPGPVVFRAGLDGAILDAPGWEALTGQPPEEHLGWGWLNAVHPDDRDGSIAAWSESLQTGKPTYMDYRLRHASGEWRWVGGYGAPVRDHHGAIVEWMGTVTDIHELRTARAALVENESFHHFAAEAGRTGSWYMRLDNREFVLSPIAADLFGLPYAQTVWTAESWDRFVAPEDQAPLRAAIAEAARKGQFFDVEFRIRREDGSERWLYSRGGVARGPSGEPLRVHGATVDLTERKQAQTRRLATVELAERLRDLEDISEMARAAAAIIGQALGASTAAFGVIAPQARLIRVDQGWSSPDMPPVGETIPFTAYAAYQTDLERGEPVIITGSLDPGRRTSHGAAVVYKPLSAGVDPLWVLHVQAVAPRPWSAEDLAFARESTERTRAAMDRHRAEKDLRELAHWLEKEVEARTTEWSRLWRNSRDLLLVIDREGVFRAANPAWTAILGWTPETVVGQSFVDFVHPDDRAATRAALADSAGAESPGFETRYRHRDGGYRWISWVTAPEDDLIYATGRHITAEKEAAEALEETQTRLRNFFETSYQYRALVSRDGKLLEVNDTALAAAGVTRDAVVGRQVWQTPWFSGTPGIPEEVRVAVALAAAGEVRREDIYLKLPAAGWRWLDFTLRPLIDSRGGTVGVVLEAVDITERHQAEAALRQSQKLEAIGQLTGGVAHDFNNLLTPIIGGLDMLQRRGLGGEREKRLIDGALQSAERAKVLVQRLLAFARRQPLQPGPVNVAALIAGMADLVNSTSGPQIRLEIDTPEGLPPAQADANQLEMAVLNLTVNARDAMPEGGELTISAAVENIAQGVRPPLSPGAYVRIAVSDTGVGMDEATRARAIEPFFSTKGHGRGTGLGLSMAHGLASQLGGALDISSQPGLGTTVQLWLPVSSTAAEDVVQQDVAVRPRTEAGTALVVDDELLARQSTAVMLTELGYRVLEASSAGEALRHAEAEPRIDLMVTDHLMPGMTGADLAFVFRKIWPDAPVLIVTGFAEAIPPEFPHLRKPFRQSDLAASLALLFEPASAKGPNVEGPRPEFRPAV